MSRPVPWGHGRHVHLLDQSPSYALTSRPSLCGMVELPRGVENHTPRIIPPTCIRCIRVARRVVELARDAPESEARPYDWRLDGL